jgi:hypothetical protein
VHVSLLSLVYHILKPTTSFFIDYSNNKVQNKKLLNMKLYPVSSSSPLLCSNIWLSALFSNTLGSRPLNLRDTGLQLYKRTGTVIIPYLLTFTLLRSRRNTKHSEPKLKAFSQISVFLKCLLLGLICWFLRKYLNFVTTLNDSLPYTSYSSLQTYLSCSLTA